MITNVDDNFGRLLAKLKEWDLERNTLVVFMTDNGHSIASLYNAGMRGSKVTPYEGGVRVPAFFRLPGLTRPGVDVPQLSAAIDLFPTFVELAGAKVPDGVKLDGRSLVPLLKDPASAAWPDRFLFTHVGRWARGKAAESKYAKCAVRTERFRLVNDRELYDIDADPGEKRNVIDAHPEQVAKMRAAYDRWWAEVLPCMENEDAVGPAVNPFKEAYWAQFPEERPK
jgi:arylsulfatase A-like enzyme